MGILLSGSHVSTTIWLHYLNSNEQSQRGTTQGCWTLFWTNPGSSTYQKQQLYSHLLPISQSIKVKWLRYAEHCWRSKDELISNDLKLIPLHECTNVDWPAKTPSLFRHWMPSRGLTKGSGQYGWMDGEGKSRKSCCQHA